MENNIEGKSKDIIKVLLGIDIIFLIILLFHSSKGFLITSIFINTIFILSFFIIDKYVSYFGSMTQSQKSANFLNKLLGNMYG